MSSLRDAVRRQRRRELDARRSKSRVRLGACLQSWGELKDRLGFSLHSELAQYLLESYFTKLCVSCSASVSQARAQDTLVTSRESLHRLVLLVHEHGRTCPLPPAAQPSFSPDPVPPPGHRHGQELPEQVCVAAEASGVGRAEAVGCDVAGRSKRSGPAETPGADGSPDGLKGGGVEECAGRKGGDRRTLCLRWGCGGGHVLSWCPAGGEAAAGEPDWAESRRRRDGPEDAPRPRKRGRRAPEEGKRGQPPPTRNARRGRASPPGPGEEPAPKEEPAPDLGPREGENKESGGGQEVEMDSGHITVVAQWEEDSEGRVSPPAAADEADLSYADDPTDRNYSPPGKSIAAAVPRVSTRGRSRSTEQSAGEREDEGAREVLREKSRRKAKAKRPTDDDLSQIGGKRIRKAAPREILPCEFEGCGKIFSTRQYLNHHMKYQHFHQKTFSCSHPTCGKSFNFKKHLKEHEKLHSNKRDYICEFCARAFRTSSNLIIHRRIHTGEKPLQCEVCGFTCRQKASLNWHMRKHNAESAYQFPCEICGKRFEKRDNVTAHRSKSHPRPPSPALLHPSVDPVGGEGVVVPVARE
ncbi:zinc finger protein 692 [Amia ocellicauda]|uniref:zinc finger protein 692 n=1 Tax=Amia ocellicauda TaxID=2972642 RepID=UPI0034648F87